MSDQSPHATEAELLERIRQLEIERDDYKAVVVVREAGYTIERMGGYWWWRNPCSSACIGPFPHMFAAARDAMGEYERKPEDK